MRVGIYGDSYASRHTLGKGVSWSEMLASQNNFTVENYGANGSSLYYSFREFERTQSQLDKIIFLVTGGARLTLNIPPEIDEYNPSLKHCTGPESLKFIIESNFRDNFYLNKLNEAVRMYYEYVLDHHNEDLYQQLLTKEIQRIRPDALLIPCFDNKNLKQFKYTMSNICNIDIKHYGLDSTKAMWADQRHGHINQQNHQIFANMISTWIDTNTFDFDITKFVPSSEPVEYYFNTEILKR
jgi:hypothetical protein